MEMLKTFKLNVEPFEGTDVSDVVRAAASHALERGGSEGDPPPPRDWPHRGFFETRTGYIEPVEEYHRSMCEQCSATRR